MTATVIKTFVLRTRQYPLHSTTKFSMTVLAYGGFKKIVATIWWNTTEARCTGCAECTSCQHHHVKYITVCGYLSC